MAENRQYFSKTNDELPSNEKIIYGKIKSDIGVILKKLCDYKGVEIIEENECKNQYIC